MQIISTSEFAEYKLLYLSDGDFQVAVRAERAFAAPQFSLVEGVFFHRPDGVIQAKTLSVRHLAPLIGQPKLWASENLPPTQPLLGRARLLGSVPGEKTTENEAVETGITVEKISDLMPCTSVFKITAKVTSRSDLKTGKTGRGAPFFSFTISDDSGSCNCYFFGESVAEKLEEISLHNTYEFSKGRVKKGTAFDGQITITFDDKSEIKLIADAAKKPILTIGQLLQSDLRDEFQVRGIVASVGMIETVRQKTSTAVQRVVRLRDASGEVNLIVTSSHAESFELNLPPELPGFVRVLTGTACRFTDSGSSRAVTMTIWSTVTVVNEVSTEPPPAAPEFTTPNKKIIFNSRIQLSDTVQKPRPSLQPVVVGVPPPKKRRTSIDRCYIVKQTPDHSFANLAGFSDAKDTITRLIQSYKTPGGEFRLNPRGVVVVAGPAACGKTFFCQAIPRSFDLPYLSIDLKELLTLFPGHAETRLKQIFRKAQRRPPPVVLFFENLDAFNNGSHVFSFDLPHRLISVFLSLVKDVKDTAIVIGDTETPWCLPTAILDYMQLLIPVGLPDVDVRRAILANAGLSLDEQRVLGELSDGRNITELKIMAAELRGQSEVAMKKYVVSNQPVINKILLDKYKTFANQHRN